MITLKFTVTLAGKTIFTEEAEFHIAKKAVMDFLTQNINVTKTAVQMTFGNSVVLRQGPNPEWITYGKAIEDYAKQQFIAGLVVMRQFDWKMPVGTKGSEKAADLVVSMGLFGSTFGFSVCR